MCLCFSWRTYNQCLSEENKCLNMGWNERHPTCASYHLWGRHLRSGWVSTEAVKLRRISISYIATYIIKWISLRESVRAREVRAVMQGWWGLFLIVKSSFLQKNLHEEQQEVHVCWTTCWLISHPNKTLNVAFEVLSEAGLAVKSLAWRFLKPFFVFNLKSFSLFMSHLHPPSRSLRPRNFRLVERYCPSAQAVDRWPFSFLFFRF